MVKDRLLDMKENRDEEDDEWADFEGGGSNDPFMNDFFEKIEAILGNIDTIQNNVEKIDELQGQILANPTNDEAMKSELDELMETTKKMGTRVRGSLKQIEEQIEETEAEGGAASQDADFRIRKSQHATAQRKFVDVMQRYNKSQCDYRDNVKGKIQRQLEIAGKEVDADELDAMLESGDTGNLTQGICADPQKAKQQLADIEARHADLMKLESSIKELHDMFMDMAMMVESQGELVDRIEYNVEHAAEYVDKATSAVRKAGEYQRAARRKKMICIGAATAAGIAAVVYLGNKFRLFSS